MQALGLIEVVGYPPAVEAADAALKAANVTLLSIAKADAGIMTVEIVGDVGAVTSAVDAGARSAARIGLVRARHVIPRVEADLIGKVIPMERIEREVEQDNPPERIKPEVEAGVPKEKIESQKVESQKVESQSKLENESKKEEETTPQEADIEEKTKTIEFSQEQLSKRSNANLKSLIKSLGIQVSAERLNTMKKQELIRLLLEYSKEHEK